ncbi:MAG: methyltransferase domain-containing protein [Bacteroidetes bacterium]|nr:methyltransferase domain-containing protein [Bacteroidota bacterium]MBS1758037.1 methyltransferase domain-containing protein [Bacteroidota bacterium]
MPYLSKLAREKKIKVFIDTLPLNVSILEIGCGNNWLKEYMCTKGYTNYTGIDINGEPDIKGDINEWEKLGLKKEQFDHIIAFEVVEHDDIWDSCFALLKKGGTLRLTTPVPSADWVLKIMEFLRLNQKRTSPHSHLTDVRKNHLFNHLFYKRIWGLSQWAILQKP